VITKRHARFQFSHELAKCLVAMLAPDAKNDTHQPTRQA
jgi:hypothetical protein